MSKKIEEWSNQREGVREFFTNDNEFEEVEASPTKFEPSASDENEDEQVNN